jgi:mRNA interferase RelE/StbE
MEITLKKQAIKDILQIPSEYNIRLKDFVFKTLTEIQNIHQIPHCSKIRGYDYFYRIRIGDYRIGFELTGNKIIIYRIMHRKDIYRFFP